jgi:glycosyltransferase involved in cell wall biosynthesis
MFWMRSFHPLYGPEVAIRVLSRVRKVYPEATLVMGGQDHDNRALVEQQARDLGLQSAVRFCGFLDMNRKIAEAGEADIFLNTNHIDNAPVTLLEACALGLPVVTTSVGGVPDLVTHGETALLVPDNDDEAMAKEVVRLLNDPNCAARLSTNGRQMTEQLSVEKVLQKWREVINNAGSSQYLEDREDE